jgi:hypothetical protein
MSLLNRPSNGLASVLMALYRALSVYGAQLEPDLIALVAPASMLGDGKPEMVKNTLNRWRVLGFFENRPDGKIELASSIPRYSPSGFVDLRSAILQLVLKERNNAGVVSSEADDEDKFPDASDLTRALAWMLAQDPYTFPDNWKEAERLQSEQRVVPNPFINDTRWAAFREWAVFLGLASTPGGRFVPNPFAAVKGPLTKAFDGRDELLISPLLEELQVSLPIVDSGRYRMQVQSQVQKPWRDLLAHEISPTLSVALLSLEASGDIRLDTRSDSPQQRSLLGRKGAFIRDVSHVVNMRGLK